MKTIYKILLLIYFITLCFVCFNQFQLSVIISLILLIPLYFFHNDLYRIEYLVYIYFTQVLGTVCHFYQYPYYDKVMHFFSGMIFVVIVYIVFQKEFHSKPLLFLFLNSMEALIAFLWEIFEYSGLVFFNYDASRHYTTGVHDTMQDMIVSFIGGLIMTFIIYKYPKYISYLYKQPQDNLEEVSQQEHT